MYRHLFSTNETSEKLGNVFGSFKLCHKTFDLNPWRSKLNLQKQLKKMYTKLKKISCSLKKKLLRRVDKMTNIKKESSKTWTEEIH